MTQGDLSSPYGKCVSNCANFPRSSCIIGGRTLVVAQALCPVSSYNVNGTNYNSGGCTRRCGMVGTGRSSRIVNGDYGPSNETYPSALPCCNTFPGDYCCNYLRMLSPNCAFGRVYGGPSCGVPIRGSEWTFANTGPGRPYGQGPITPYAPTPYYREEKAYMYPYANQFPMNYMAPPLYMRYPSRPPVYRPPVPRPYVASPSDQKPSQFICSCDSGCKQYQDCCSDFQAYCCGNLTNASMGCNFDD